MWKILFSILIKAIALLCISFNFIILGFAQKTPRPEIDLDAFILDLFPQQDEDINYEDVYETLFQLYRNPLNLNTATRDELAALFILSESQINSLLEHRSKTGKLLSVYELQAIPNFDLNDIYKILPFVAVEDEAGQSNPLSLWQRIKNEKDNHYLLLRYDRNIETRKGFTDKASPSQKYLGSPERMYARYRISHSKDFSLGFTLEKDAGEQYLWDSQTRTYGMDFFSFHTYFQNKGKFKSFAFGDYQLQFGQGLLLSAGLTIGKGAETVNTLRRSNLGIKPYTSTLETGFFRGAAATYSLGNFDLTGFYSRVHRDASLSEETSDTLENQQELFIESIRTSGFHRTESEIQGKGRFLENTLGSNLTFRSKADNFTMGATYIYTAYNLPFQKNSRNPKDSLRNLFEFSGKTNYNLGLNFSCYWQNFNFFGEGAISKSGGKGLLTGFVASLAPHVDMAMLYRNYEQNFHTFFGSAISENTRNINEKGLYWGIKINPIRKILVSAYYDYFKFPWLKYRVDAPSKGFEYLLKFNYKISRKINLYAQFREENKERNISRAEIRNPINGINPTIKRNYILNLDYKAEKIVNLRSRLQWSSFDFNQQRTKGLAMIQDIGIELGNWEVNARFALFDTEDFDNRQYIFEKDVLWAFSIPAYQGRGLRNYFLLSYQINRSLECWLRYARFDYKDREVIGSRANEIQGSTQSEIKIQLRIKL